jgi:hypothetical protein
MLRHEKLKITAQKQDNIITVSDAGWKMNPAMQTV